MIKNRNNKRLLRRVLVWSGCLALGVLLIVGCFYLVVVANAAGRTYDDAEEIPHNKYGMLLATSPITPAGLVNHYFQNRIISAEQLYKAGKVDTIIASGGDYTKTQKHGYDEPKAIRDSLVARGVPTDRILLDYQGTRTINSVKNARDVYKLDSVTFISQKEHNERAIYLADKEGLHSIGFNARPSHILAVRIKNHVREFFARPKMFLDIWTGY